ncbi:phage tail protein [Aquibaculum arenosum]|uniref:Phage tail protein n=1 Tax=Aquibaculum arenosum TaxID=3032591 RepID=A0ABT5YQR9_9PROT|nr:phage tail protein [Fodinicurvata sp. CAU 1616]MDF2097321.1 phage tail protein [Fodinicurvata sp. CAU 1616]
MATLALSIGGGLVGASLFPAGVTLFGATLGGAAIGQAVGGLAGAAIDALWLSPSLPRQRMEGPRLQELRVTGGDYGTGIPQAYGGAVRLAGTVIWLSPVVETREEKSEDAGGKGGGGEVETVEYKYHVDVALALAAGPIADVRRLWADGHVIWQNGKDKPSTAEAITIHRGTESQQPDPLIEAHEGAGQVPGFRGLAYIVLERLALHRHGGRLPNLVAEVVLPPARSRLADAVTDLCRRAGVEDVNATALEGQALQGYIVPRVMSPREAIEPLQRSGFFDARLEEEGLVFQLLDQPVMHEVEAADLGAGPQGQPGPRLPTVRADARALPRAIAVQYADAQRDRQPGVQQARRQASGSHVETELQLPQVLYADEARAVAERSLELAWHQRETIELALPSAARRLAAGDLLRLTHQGQRYDLRVLERSVTPEGVWQFSTVSDEAHRLPPRPGAVAPIPTSPYPRPPSASELHVLDLPALRARDDDAGVYLAAVPETPQRPWPGAALYEVRDGELLEQTRIGIAAITGRSLEALPAASPHLWDEVNSVRLQLDDPDRILTSHSAAAVLAGSNALLLGEEVLQFREAVALGDGEWRLSGLLRGRLGTEGAIAGHASDERAVLLAPRGISRLPLPVSALGVTRSYKAVTLGTDPDLVAAESYAPAGRALRPWAPAHLRGTRQANGDWELSWVRRARLDRGWRDGVDVALDEAQERYRLQVLDGGGAVLRSVEVTSPAYSYTAAQQTADHGDPVEHPRIRVAQLSAAVGAGDFTEETL